MDYILVLEGEQGTLKSELVRVLGGDFASENLPDFKSRDAMQIAGSRHIIEVSELASMRRSEVEDVKAFSSRCEDTYVPKYARNPITVKRCSVLVGTTNATDDYLPDQSGNRRFWPVRVTKIDIGAFKRDRDQLMAEAVARFNAAECWWIENDAQRELLEEAQEDRTEADPWEPEIANYVGSRAEASIHEIARDALLLEPRHFNHAAKCRIGTVLRKLGFVKLRPRRAGAKDRTRLYRRKET